MSDARTEVVKLRVTPEEKATIEGRAARDGLTLSSYVRRRVLGDVATNFASTAAPSASSELEALTTRLARANGWPMIRARAVARDRLKA